MSKGSLQRPSNRKKYEANYERIFGNKPATNKECQLGDKCVDDCMNCSIGWKKKKNTITVGGIECEYNTSFPGPEDPKLIFVRNIRKGDVIYPCKCDSSIGENCEECYSPRGTKPCLGRYCGDCGIKGCSVRVVEEKMVINSKDSASATALAVIHALREIELRAIQTRKAFLKKCVNGEYWCELCPDGCGNCNYGQKQRNPKRP